MLAQATSTRSLRSARVEGTVSSGGSAVVMLGAGRRVRLRVLLDPAQHLALHHHPDSVDWRLEVSSTGRLARRRRRRSPLTTQLPKHRRQRSHADERRRHDDPTGDPIAVARQDGAEDDGANKHHGQRAAEVARPFRKRTSGSESCLSGTDTSLLLGTHRIVPGVSAQTSEANPFCDPQQDAAWHEVISGCASPARVLAARPRPTNLPRARDCTTNGRGTSMASARIRASRTRSV